MVVFTCNHCGESLQKPKVEKHYQFTCKNPIFLTCVDCLKDFRGNEFDVHTKCFTEDERYAAKGSMVGVVKKGEVKQESWVEMIRSIINEEPNMKAPHRNLLNKISSYSNVPRKKPKFINFITNSSGGRINLPDVEAVWDIIEKYKQKHNNSTNSDSTKTNSSNKIEEESVSKDLNLCNTSEINKKMKKKKDGPTLEESVLVENSSKPKKTSQRNSENGVPTENTDKPNLHEKSEKKKRKKSQVQLNGDAIENVQTLDCVGSQDVALIGDTENCRKKPKRKSDQQAQEPLKTDTVEAQKNGIAPSKIVQENGKSKGKLKRKSDVQIEGIVDEPAEKRVKQEITAVQETNGSTNNTKFDFKTKVIEILQTVDTIGSKKLQKKIKKLYLKETGEAEFSEKALKKYTKKLKQIENIEFADDTVRLIKSVT